MHDVTIKVKKQQNIEITNSLISQRMLKKNVEQKKLDIHFLNVLPQSISLFKIYSTYL